MSVCVCVCISVYVCVCSHTNPLTVSNLIADLPHACRRRLTYISHAQLVHLPPHLDLVEMGIFPNGSPSHFLPPFRGLPAFPGTVPVIKALPQVGPQYPHVERVVHTATIHSILHQTMHEVPLRWTATEFTDTSLTPTSVSMAPDPSCTHCLSYDLRLNIFSQ